MSPGSLFARARTAIVATLLSVLLAHPSSAHAASRNFATGSLIIPIDLVYQDLGMLQAYGLVSELLRQGVPVYWSIDPAKSWHAAPCNTAGDECAWDCDVEGSGIKCPYPTASPDFFAATRVLWDDGGAPGGTTIASHGYRGGPFVVDATAAAAARAIVAAWNDPGHGRAVFRVVTVHEATAGFAAPVDRVLVAPPRVAVLADGNEDIATGYLRAAGIVQVNGSEFPAARCSAGACGPGTANPSLLPPERVMGDLGTCTAPNADHRNGALFTPAGEPAFCQFVSAHWNVGARETVQCNGAPCPATAAACAGQPLTFHGHELVAELRAFLRHPVRFVGECQSVLAFENTTPNPAWPFLDDAGRDGHLLTIPGTPPPCPCAAGFTCVPSGCGGSACCLPTDPNGRGAGLFRGAQPASAAVQVLRPAAASNQLDGSFGPVGGSEPSFDLSLYFGTAYRLARPVTLLTGPAGPGAQDVWIEGALDGGAAGRVSYLGGHAFATATPFVSGGSSQGTRLFLNALFDATCMVGPDIFRNGFEDDAAAP